jgi:hypothetical protein
VIGGVCVYGKEDYRKMTIEMVKNIQNENILEYLYVFIKGKAGQHVEKEKKY